MSQNEEQTTPSPAKFQNVRELTDMNDLVSLCKRTGYVYPSSDIYGGINACWDYGPLGSQLKLNLKNRWWKAMTDRSDVEGLDAAILMHPKVWEASGHVEGFSDPLIECKICKQRFREDKIDWASVDKGICPNDKKPHPVTRADYTAPRNFNLMFKTFMGPVEDSANVVFLRPETAQGIFVNFQNVQTTSRQKIPFGIAQIGKAFRNEITPGNFIFRTREFEQMEMQFFVKPGQDDEWFEKWKKIRLDWHLANGLRAEKMRFHPHGEGELAHYAKAAFDIEYQFPFGWQEFEGIHNRTDFDLGRHQKYSGKKLEYFEEATKERFLPYVIETSAGCDRTLLAILADAYRVDEERTWLKLHPELAPYKVAIFPLMKKPELTAKSDTIFAEVRKKFRAITDASGTIGKRYRRHDEIGTPFCVTVDYDSLETGIVTVRHRDTMAQDKIPSDQLAKYLEDRIENWNSEQ